LLSFRIKRPPLPQETNSSTDNLPPESARVWFGFQHSVPQPPYILPASILSQRFKTDFSKFSISTSQKDIVISKMEDQRPRNPALIAAPAAPKVATTKKTRISKYKWVQETHCDEILPSWGLEKCLAYLALSECTQLKLPGCKSPGTITITQIKDLVYQKLLSLLNNNTAESQIQTLDLNAVVYSFNLQQCLLEIAFPELTLPCLMVNSGSKDSVLQDAQRVYQNALRVVGFMDQLANTTPLILFGTLVS
jgi:hypothetical protein